MTTLQNLLMTLIVILVRERAWSDPVPNNKVVANWAKDIIETCSVKIKVSDLFHKQPLYMKTHR